MRGRFIVCEGVDGSGKTSTIEKAIMLAQDNRIIMNKGFSRDNIWGSYINNHPRSWLYYLDMAYDTIKDIRPRLRKGHIILQDRYVQSIDTYVPDRYYFHNKVLRRILNPIYCKPYAYVMFTASLEEIVDRLLRAEELGKEISDKYHQDLVKNPAKILVRNEQYDRIYASYQGNKHIIDTTGKTTDRCAEELVAIIRGCEHAS